MSFNAKEVIRLDRWRTTMEKTQKTSATTEALGTNAWMLVIVAALGYFVDAYDLIVASVARGSAIVELGLAQPGTVEHKSWAFFFENAQSAGILIGGICFGILGDKVGRKRVLYASIFLYSVANLANGMLTSSIPNVGEVYSALRFVGGFALAAELSIGIVMISETLKAKNRGYGSMIVVSFGVLGCVLAAVLFEFAKVSWRTLFIIGGVAGLMLLGLRYGIRETRYFLQEDNKRAERGNLMMVLRSGRLAKIFVGAILMGFPIYYFVSIPIKFAADYGKEFGLTIAGTIPIIVFYLVLSLSDILANLLSQLLKSRKKVIYCFIGACLIPILGMHFLPPTRPEHYIYIYSPLMGLASGYWALLVTFTAEQIGTNMRATFTTAVPNIIRSLFIPISLLLGFLQPAFGTSTSVFFMGLAAVALGFLGNFLLQETWGRNLNFVESETQS